MSHFAKIDENNIVTDVLVIEQDMINTGRWGDPTTFIQTSYNTYGGIHQLGGIPLRKNYACIGCFYDEIKDAFIYPKPNNTFDDDGIEYTYILDDESCSWVEQMV